MAKSKKHTRRKKVSGLGAMLNPKSPLIKLAAIAGGFFMGDTINTFLDTLIPDSLTVATPATATTPAKPAMLSADAADQILMVGEVGLGALLLLKGKPHVIKSLAGGVLAGAGLQRAAISFKIIKPAAVKGYQHTPVLGGYQRTPVLGAVPPQLAGTLAKSPAQLQGYGSRGSGMGAYGSQGSGVMGSLYTNADNGSGITSAGSGYMN